MLRESTNPLLTRDLVKEKFLEKGSTKAIILVAGQSKRLRPFIKDIPMRARILGRPISMALPRYAYRKRLQKSSIAGFSMRIETNVLASLII